MSVEFLTHVQLMNSANKHYTAKQCQFGSVGNLFLVNIKYISKQFSPRSRGLIIK